MAESTKITEPKTGLYHGLKDRATFSKAVETCENLWNEEFKVGKFDELIASQINHAIVKGRNDVVIVDIGSGSGNLFQNFLTVKSVSSLTQSLLMQHPEIQVRLIGLTDAESSEEFLHKTSIAPDESLFKANQVHAENISYSLSRTQRLREFFDDINVNNVDLVVSTWALTYLGPETFRNVVTDITERVRPVTGQCIATAYAEIYMPGFAASDTQFGPDLDIREAEPTKSTIKSLIESVGSRINKNNVNLDEEEQTLRKTEAMMVRLGLLTTEELEKSRKKFGDFSDDPNSPYYRSLEMSRRYSETVYGPLTQLTSRKANYLKERKIAILNLIENSLGDKLTIQTGKHTFVINMK